MDRPKLYSGALVLNAATVVLLICSQMDGAKGQTYTMPPLPSIPVTPAPPPPAAVVKAASLTYIVMLKGQPVVGAYSNLYNGSRLSWRRQAVRQQANAYARKLVAGHDTFLKSALRPGSYKKLYSYSHVLNGFVVKLTSQAQVAALQKYSGFLKIEKDSNLVKSTTYTPQLLKLPTGAWNFSGGVDNAGEDIIIGTIDTGVTPQHPSILDNTSKPYGPIPSTYLGSCNTSLTFPAGSCNKKLIGAAYFAEGALAIGFLDPDYDSLSPVDGDGHGTHTSGIAGGNNGLPVIIDTLARPLNFGSITGIAPRARISAYKCVYRDGGILSDCVAALDKAVQDGVHIITMSLGPAGPPGGYSYLSSFDLAMLFAVKAGITVIQSTGNYGPSLGTSTSYSPWIISVGATNTGRTYPVTLNLGNNNSYVGDGLSTSLPSSLQLISAFDAILNQSAPAPQECQDSTDLDPSFVSGKILMCFYTDNFDFGDSQVVLVVETARDLNASGFILVANDPDLYFPIFFEPIPFVLPGVFFRDLTTSQAIVNYYTSHTVYSSGVLVSTTATASISSPPDPNAQFGSLNPVVADYSSRGPSIQNADVGDVGDVLKPDLVAPGTQIWSAWATEGIDSEGFMSQSYALLSGTSMAAPHVAGVAAMLKQKFPTWSPAAIRSALVTTATVIGSDGKALQAQYPVNAPNSATGNATPFDMGGGFINPTNAFNPGLIFDCGFNDYVAFMCSVPGITQSAIASATGTACNISAGALPSDLNTPSITIAKLQGKRNVTRTMTSVATTTETYTLTFSVPSGVSMTISPTSLTIAPAQSTQFTVTIKATSTIRQFTYGRIIWTGNAGHVVTIPVTTFPYSL